MEKEFGLGTCYCKEKLSHMKKLLLVCLLLIAAIIGFAQTEENAPSLSADRPGMATGPDVTPFLKVVWETGFESYFTDEPGILLPTTMVRFGVTRFAELRLEYDGVLNRYGSHKWGYDVQPLVVGTKVKIFEGYKWVPKIAMMANLSIPLVRHIDADSNIQRVAPSLYLLFQNDVTDWFNIGYNVGVEWSGYSPIPTAFLALCLGFNITDDFGAFIESYNYFTHLGKRNTEVECNLDFGFSYAVHPRVQLDLYGMFNCQNPKAFNGIGLGVAWLIN